MRSMLGRLICLLVAICAGGNVLAQDVTFTPAQIEEFRVRLITNDGELLPALFKLEEHEAVIGQLIPALTKLIIVGNDATLRAAARCLGRVGDRAEPATGAIIARLDHHDYIVRAELMPVLTGIGSAAIPALQKALGSSSAKVRASALSVLNELTVVDVGILEPLENDPDVRVRICVAQAWKKYGSRGVEKMVAYLKDPEPLVAVGAARALRFHFADIPVAVPALMESLARKEVGWMSATALQSYGVEAQAAIPLLIRSYPLGGPDGNYYQFDDIVAETLYHIGPPAVEDLEPLRKLLDDASPTVRALAAVAIGRLGALATESVDDLDRMFQASLREAAEQEARLAAIVDEDEQGEFLRSHPRYSLAVTSAMAAIWRISGNTGKLIQMMTEASQQCGSAMYFGKDSPFSEFTEKDCPLLLKMMDNPDVNVRECGKVAFLDVTPKNIPLEFLEKLRQSGSGFDDYHFRMIAPGMDQRMGAQIGVWLIEDQASEKLAPREFARIVAALGIRDATTLQILQRGLESRDNFLPNQCLAALAALSEDAGQAAGLLVSNARKNTRLRLTALESFWTPPGPSELVIPFAMECLGGPDAGTKRRAIMVLARFGAEAKDCLSALEKIPVEKPPELSGKLEF